MPILSVEDIENEKKYFWHTIDISKVYTRKEIQDLDLLCGRSAIYLMKRSLRHKVTETKWPYLKFTLEYRGKKPYYTTTGADMIKFLQNNLTWEILYKLKERSRNTDLLRLKTGSWNF